MSKKDPRVDAYIKKSAAFAQPILTHLRACVHANCKDASETIKWGMPFFMNGEKILCHMAAFKAHCAFSFWEGMRLPIDAATGKKEKAMGQFGRIASLTDLPGDKEMARLIKAAIKLSEADALEPARAKPVTEKKLDVPDDLKQALKKNKKALATFDAFSYSNKKEYAEWITEAKTEATRLKRLAQAIELMAEGKVRNWKYVK
jgi:uncharacterized protein YdeI (YjbR/CyaY-like superfamily)